MKLSVCWCIGSKGEQLLVSVQSKSTGKGGLSEPNKLPLNLPLGKDLVSTYILSGSILWISLMGTAHVLFMEPNNYGTLMFLTTEYGISLSSLLSV